MGQKWAKVYTLKSNRYHFQLSALICNHFIVFGPIVAVFSQVASRELNIPASLIHISETSTQCVPNTCPSAASFGTDANGMAVKVSNTRF